MELEVGELFFELQEIVKIEHFVESTCSVEIIHRAVGSLQRLKQPHYLRTQRGHAGTAAYPHHLLLAVSYGVEVAVRTAHQHLIARFQSEDIA